MAFLTENYKMLIEAQELRNVTLVAVSKTKPNKDILEAYNNGLRDFGENYVQELSAKHDALPKDIRWHFIGHLQSNKVKYIIQFVYLIQGVDSEKLLAEIDRQSKKSGRVVQVLLQVHIAEEETKFGFDEQEIKEIQPEKYPNVAICGLMGMASFSTDENKVMNEFRKLKLLYDQLRQHYPLLSILSMGMSGDYKQAIDAGSNMIRIGSMLFGEREKKDN